MSQKPPTGTGSKERRSGADSLDRLLLFSRRPLLLRNPSGAAAAAAAAVAAQTKSRGRGGSNASNSGPNGGGNSPGGAPGGIETGGNLGSNFAGTNSAGSDLISSPSSNMGNQSNNGSSSSNVGNNGTVKKPNRSRSRLIGTNVNIGYAQQEKAYLRRIRNQLADDYYTKGIGGDDDDELLLDVATDEDTNDVEDFEFEEISKRELLDLELDLDIAQRLMGGEITNTEDPSIGDRMAWQNMLLLVLMGDVVRSEKTKIGSLEVLFLQGTYRESLWYGIRAKLCGRTEDEQRKVVLFRRTLADRVIQEIMEFEVKYEGPEAIVQVRELLEKWDSCCVNWRTLEELKSDKIICRSKEFNDRLDALTSWLNIRDGLDAQIHRIKQWIDSATESPPQDSQNNHHSNDHNNKNGDGISTPTFELPAMGINLLPFRNQNQNQDQNQNQNNPLIDQSPVQSTLNNDHSQEHKISNSNVSSPSNNTNNGDNVDENSKMLAGLKITPDEEYINPPFIAITTIPSTSSSTKPKLAVQNPNELLTPLADELTSSPRHAITPLDVHEYNGTSLAEQLMKKKDLQQIFYTRIFTPLSPWFIKAKSTYIRLQDLFELLKLPDYIHDVIQLFLVPARLIKEIINVRLQYAMRLQNPTLMMIDQMIDDFKLYINVALEVRALITEYCRPDINHRWIVKEFFEQELAEFDQVVLSCVRYFLVLLNRKLLDGSRNPMTFRTFKEPEELEETWRYLRCLGVYFEGGSVVVAEQITALTSRLVHRLLTYLNYQMCNPPRTPKTTAADLNRWYSSTTENYGQLRRKLARFFVEISRDFSNALTFDIAPSKIKILLEELRETGHFLVYTGSIESESVYLFASRGLQGREKNILKILQGGYIGTDGEVKLRYTDLLREELSDLCPNTFDNEESMFEYVLAICPPKPIVWDGPMINMPTDEIHLTEVKTGTVLLVAQHPHRLQQIKESFDLPEEIFRSQMGQRCLLPKVHHEFSRINKAFFKTALFVLDSVQIIRKNCKEISPEADFLELINNSFIYARDYAKNALRHVDPKRRSTIVLKLIQLSINWVSFICDDCIPTDRKTFRWCVLALEFAMEMTKGFNVFALSEEQFYGLKLKVARCMSLLISHFDIMGARLLEAEKRKLLKLSALRQNTADDERLIQMYHEEVLKEIEALEEHRDNLVERPVGKVIDVMDQEYQFVTLLALLFLLVSIRWQKGRFIGGGLFGLVYAAVNLDTGGVMAVKEIRFTDVQLVKNIVPMIRDEMTVLEILNHPNIVQYHGVEVHRDRVYIFMEYCEGGSLLNLLTHGRIEDEMVIQVYTLQMLEGLAYLHQSGVVHRDIKPENILLDHNGIIKFVDFGAAKVIATTGRTRSNMGANSNGSNHSVEGNSGSNNNSNNNNGNGNNNGHLGAPPAGSMTGTPMYMSPEVINGLALDRNGSVDIWSLGCCVLEMATGRRPWANLDNEWAIMYNIAAGHKPQLPLADQLSEPGRHFISRCLEHDPKRRPSAAELLQDPWIDHIRKLAFDNPDTATPSSEAPPELAGP